MASNSIFQNKNENGQTGDIQKGLSKEVTRRLRIQNKKLLEQVSLMKIQLKEIKAEKNEIQSRLANLTNLNNSVAGAFGSCSRCWGGDPDCDICGGRGSPGWRNFDKGFFKIHILPKLAEMDVLGRKKGK